MDYNILGDKKLFLKILIDSIKHSKSFNFKVLSMITLL